MCLGAADDDDGNDDAYNIEEHSGRCLSAAVFDNQYNVTETKMAESQPS